VKKVLIVSLILNFVFVSVGGYIFFQKGGFNRFKTQNAATYTEGRILTFKNLQESTHNIVFVGDSLTEGGEWSELFNNSNILNRGINGDNTESVLNRISDIVDGHPKKIFIMIGINDLEHKLGVQETMNNYKKILSLIKETSPNTKIYVQSVLPNNKNIRALAVNTSEIKKLNKGIENLSKHFDATYIDLFSKTVDNSGNLRDELTYDGIHLKAEGYFLWKKAIENFVKED
jgi:lysophospholipase L1-like esterase